MSGLMRRSFLFFLALTACGQTMVVIDGGPPNDASGGPSGTIEIASESSLTLTFDETSEIVLRYYEMGDPVAGIEIRFALEGNANDAHILDLALVTDEDGWARTTLTGSSSTSVFRVRASADRAAPVFIDVSVGDEGFGELVIELPYEGSRTEATQRVVSVYSGIECDPPDGYPRTPARGATLADPMQDEVSWRTLAAGLTYTVVGRVEGPTGAPLALGCIDGIEIIAETETRVVLEFTDTPLVPEGTYDVELAISSDGFADISSRGVDAGVAFAGSGIGAPVFLDALDVELRFLGYASEADALAIERASGTAESDLDNALSSAAADPAEGLRRFFSKLLELFAQVRVSGPLELTFDGTGLQGIWVADELNVGAPSAPDGPDPLPIDLATSGLDPSPVIGLTYTGAADRIHVDALSLALPRGELVSAAMDAAILDPASTPGSELRELSGCRAFALWIASSSVSGVCDAGCADVACVAALGGMIEASRTGVMSEGGLGTITLRGPVMLFDDNGDLMVERLEGTLPGEWITAMGRPSISVTGELAGSRVRSAD